MLPACLQASQQGRVAQLFASTAVHLLTEPAVLPCVTPPAATAPALLHAVSCSSTAAQHMQAASRASAATCAAHSAWCWVCRAPGRCSSMCGHAADPVLQQHQQQQLSRRGWTVQPSHAAGAAPAAAAAAGCRQAPEQQSVFHLIRCQHV